MPRPLTADAVKARLRRQGQTITAWAEAHGYERRDVYRVLGGQLRGHYGRAHQIAVALGLVDDSEEPSTTAAGRNPQNAQAA